MIHTWKSGIQDKREKINDNDFKVSSFKLLSLYLKFKKQVSRITKLRTTKTIKDLKGTSG